MYRDFIHSAEAVRRTRFARSNDFGGSRWFPQKALGEALIRLGTHLVSGSVGRTPAAGASS